MARLINIDSGGTLTGVCVLDAGRVQCAKTLTTPADADGSLVAALTKAAKAVYGTAEPARLLAEAKHLRYVTPQASAILEGLAGSTLALLGTEPDLPSRLAGDRRQHELLNLLVGDRFRSVALDATDADLESQVVAAMDRFAAQGVTQLVVSAGGSGGARAEERIRDLLSAREERVGPARPSPVFSRELVGDHDDNRRTWTCLLNAFVHPATEAGLSRVHRLISRSSGGTTLLVYRNDGESSRAPHVAGLMTYGSGPRGGLEGTRALAEAYGLERAVMVDSGGSTTETAPVWNFQPQRSPCATIAGIPVSLDLADITSHAIGGGSVLRVHGDEVSVGPDSVGADPGPACFGRGGSATMTDVLLVRGILHPGTYLDGTVALNAEQSMAAIRSDIADPLGVSLREALVAAERSYVRRLAQALSGTDEAGQSVLVASGGAGPMLICDAAREAGMRRVLVPRHAATLSAIGSGLSDLTRYYTCPLDAVDAETVHETLRRLRQRAKRELSGEGVHFGECAEHVRLRIRRAGTEMLLPLDQLDGPDSPDERDGGLCRLELAVTVPLEDSAAGMDADGYASTAARAGLRAISTEPHGSVQVPVFRLPDQQRGAYAAGPAVLEGEYFTMYVPELWEFQVTVGGDLLLTDRDVPPPG